MPDYLAQTQDATTMRIWQFWEGPKPAYIDLCFETMVQHNPAVEILNMERFRNEFWVADQDIDISHLDIPHQADWIRLYLLKHYGGLWVDADCIVVRPLDRFLDALRCCWSLAHCESRNRVGGSFFGAPPNSFHINGMYKKSTAIVQENRPVRWREILGEVIDSELIRHNYAGFFRCDMEQLMPVRFWVDQGFFFTRSPDKEHAKYFHDLAYTYILGNNSYPKDYRKLSRDEILADDTFLAYLFRRALGLEEIN